MTIQQFIEAAIEGGYPDPNPLLFLRLPVKQNFLWAVFKDLVLDPKAWEAVGKVKDWVNSDKYRFVGRTNYGNDLPAEFKISFEGQEWQWHMVCMIDSLIKGKSLEEYIATL